MSSKEDGKSEKMKGKTEELRKIFNLPQFESCIQDYMCSLSHKGGRMFVTQNYICWIPGAISIGATPTLIPFNKVKAIKKERNALVFDNALSVDSESGDTYFFASLVHRDETFNLLEYLWKHPPSYVEIDEEPDDPRISARSSQNSGYFEDININDVDGKRSSSVKDDYKRTSSSSDGSQVQASKVDTQTTKNALRIATQARDVGTATLAELTIQAEQIDRIENNVENIHANMDKANRILRGIESVGGAIANSVTKDNTGRAQNQGVDRTLDIHREYPPVDFEILEKEKNDNLVPALLRLFEDKFMHADPQTKKPKTIWSYDKIDQLVVRARHQHLDIRFKDKSRFRMCISDIQGVVNEISLRTKPGQIQVIFEPGTRKFSYGKPQIREKEKSTNPRTGGGGGFRRNNPQQKSVTKTVFKDASDETKQSILEQEKDLDEISDIVGDLAAIANTMGDELDRQNEQLDRVERRVDEANVKVKKTNQRIDRLL